MKWIPDIFQGLWYALLKWDKKTAFHCVAVAELSEVLTRSLGLDAAIGKAAWWAGMLHDLGKIGIPLEILNKPGSLNIEEWSIIKTHPGRAARILAPFADIALSREFSCSSIINIIVAHHERWDGKGYPYGLSGENIPKLARIIAVADAYHSMSEIRPYRKALTFFEIWQELENGAGKQFDPLIVERFLSLLSKLNNKKVRVS